jgi:hypothetical protein
MSILKIARNLADLHRVQDKYITNIFLYNSRNEIRLVEISESCPYSGEVLPFKFANKEVMDEFEFPVVIVLLCPQEWQEVIDGKLSLPKGWNKFREI